MEAVPLQVVPSFYTSFQKTVFLLLQTLWKLYCELKKCVGRHDDKIAFVPNCRNHFVLIGDIKEVLQKLDAFCSN